jgi:hypothetical protein
MTELATNVLYYGDNLDILRRYLPDASVDLIYLDPPFNSNRDYNVIFKDESGNPTDAQLLAFEDTWHWGRPDVRDNTLPLGVGRLAAYRPPGGRTTELTPQTETRSAETGGSET